MTANTPARIALRSPSKASVVRSVLAFSLLPAFAAILALKLEWDRWGDRVEPFVMFTAMGLFIAIAGVTLLIVSYCAWRRPAEHAIMFEDTSVWIPRHWLLRSYVHFSYSDIRSASVVFSGGMGRMLVFESATRVAAIPQWWINSDTDLQSIADAIERRVLAIDDDCAASRRERWKTARELARLTHHLNWGAFAIPSLLCVVYALQLVLSDHLGAASLLRWGGNVPFLSLHGQPERILTAGVLHASVQHLIVNVLAAAVLGQLMSVWLGAHRVWILFVMGVAVGGWVSATLGTGLSVGASPGIFGWLGAWAALSWIGRRTLSPPFLFLPAGIVIVIAIEMTSAPFANGIDVRSHAGGALAGAVIGSLFGWQQLRASGRLVYARPLVPVRALAWGLGLLLVGSVTHAWARGIETGRVGSLRDALSIYVERDTTDDLATLFAYNLCLEDALTEADRSRLRPLIADAPLIRLSGEVQLLAHACLDIRAGSSDSAIERIRRVLAGPQSPHAHWLLGQAHRARGRPATFTTMLRAHPNADGIELLLDAGLRRPLWIELLVRGTGTDRFARIYVEGGPEKRRIIAWPDAVLEGLGGPLSAVVVGATVTAPLEPGREPIVVVTLEGDVSPQPPSSP